ncbi:MAG: hypothetical protein QW043_00825, partial [Desulfurococcaceae archaeon]
QAVGNYMLKLYAPLFQHDVRCGNEFTSMIGLYRAVDDESGVGVLLGLHAWLWLFQEGSKRLTCILKRNLDYKLPSDIAGNVILVSEITGMLRHSTTKSPRTSTAISK